MGFNTPSLTKRANLNIPHTAPLWNSPFVLGHLTTPIIVGHICTTLHIGENGVGTQSPHGNPCPFGEKKVLCNNPQIFSRNSLRIVQLAQAEEKRSRYREKLNY